MEIPLWIIFVGIWIVGFIMGAYFQWNGAMKDPIYFYEGRFGAIHKKALQEKEEHPK